MVDEIHLAGPKALAMDIIFPEAEKARWEDRGDGKFEQIDDDQLFANSLRRLGCTLMPVVLLQEPPKVPTLIERELRVLLREDLEITESAAPGLLRRRGVPEKNLQQAIEHGFLDSFLDARQEVMHERIVAELRLHPRTRDELRIMLLPKIDPQVHSPAVRLFDESYAQAVSELALLRLSAPIPANIPPLLHSESAMTPVSLFSQAAAATAFVDNPKSGAVLRQIPLFMEYGGRMYPQLGVELAAMMLDADLKDLRFTENDITIPRNGADAVHIPVRTVWSTNLRCPVPTMFDIPWYGKPDSWETMYDKVGGAHLSLNVVWDACQIKRRIVRNNGQIDESLQFLYAAYAPEKLRTYAQKSLPMDDPLNRLELCKAALTDYGPEIEFAQQTNLSEIKDQQERAAIERTAAQGPALRSLIAENFKFHDQLIAQRAMLRERLHGKAIIVGWTSTAQTFDEVATSIHAKCPGVVAHGTIFNAIMTTNTWRRLPKWVDIPIILAMGLFTTVLATRLLPYRALIAAIMLAGIYFILNGELFFDWGKHIVPLAAPLVAVAVAWAGCTLARLLTESWERARITHRFRTYVDPALVQYVIDHPELARLEGEVREMTVCFTDLVGFTSLTERLREKAVKILGRYMTRMVPAIRRHRGFVHRFMGDGIMFSYGAPIPNPQMAADAVSTVLEMHVELAKLNEELEAEGNPRLAIRAGVNTGPAVVGDSGAHDAVEYACLGDTTNTAARLESANGALGTSTLIAGRTVELLSGQFLLRPVARLVVKGKAEAVMTFEPLALIEAATPSQKQLAERTTAMFDHFVGGRFAECIVAAAALEEAFGPSKLAAIYRNLCNTYLGSPPTDFCGHIVLSEK
jgi:class 3 adenylate cyclase